MEFIKRRSTVSILLATFLTLSTNNLLAQPDLYVSTGDTITVQPGTTLHVTGAIEGDGYVQLKADVSGYAQLSQDDNVANTGNIILGKRLSTTSAGWRQMAFPFAGTYGDLDFNSTMTFINSTNNGGIPARQNFYTWNATDAGLDTATGWEVVSTATSLPSAATVYMANNAIHDFAQDLLVTGTPKNGDVAYSLLFTIDPGYTSGLVTDATGWNFIPNPYPSNLSVTQIFAASGFPTYEALHIWDVNAGQYVAVIPSGIAVSYNTGSNDNSTTHIAPMEGFWVKADATGNTLTLTNAVRDVDGAATAFLKTTPELLRLNISSSTGELDQLVVYFDDNATPSFDNGLEALKRLGNSSNPQISILDGNRQVSISALPYGDHSLPINVEVPQAGATYAFELDTEEFDPWSTVELEDTYTGKIYDMRTQLRVSLQLMDASYHNRFILHINKSGISIAEQYSQSGFTAWQNANGSLVLECSESNEMQAEVFSVDGQHIMTVDLNPGSQTVVDEHIAPGVYIIKLPLLNTAPQKIILY